MLRHLRPHAAVVFFLLAFTPHAFAGHMGGDFGYAILLGLFPFLALPVIAILCLLIWRAPWHYRAWSLLVLALSMMLIAAIAGSKVFDPPWYVAPVLWIVPLGVWITFTKWLNARRKQS